MVMRRRRTKEVTMVASNARAMLKKENEMLDNLVQTASAFAQKASGTEADVFNAWVQELQGHRDANSDLIGMTDAEFDRELNEEIKVLEGMRAAITGNRDVDAYWKGNIGDDIAISKKLL
jgi:uncharacterized protein with von Willebrand factor type A (vWA) domain